MQSGYNQEQGILILRISSAYCAAIKDNTALSLTAILNAKIDVGKHMKLIELTVFMRHIKEDHIADIKLKYLLFYLPRVQRCKTCGFSNCLKCVFFKTYFFNFAQYSNLKFIIEKKAIVTLTGHNVVLWSTLLLQFIKQNRKYSSNSFCTIKFPSTPLETSWLR